MKNIEFTSKLVHRDKLNMKDYIAKLGLPTGKYKYDREFLQRNGYKDKNGYAYFTWNITESGVYEIREDLEYMLKTTYIVINNNGDIQEIQTANEIQGFLNSMDHWLSLSKFKVQLYQLRFRHNPSK